MAGEMNKKPAGKMNFSGPRASKDMTADGEMGLTSPSVGKRGVLLDRTPDDELLQLHRRGDERAFDVLVGRYQDTIYNFMASNAGDEEVARDLAQEAFVRAFANLAGFRGDSLFKTWLFRIARNVAVDHYRRQRRRKEVQVQMGAGDDDAEEGVASLGRRGEAEDGLKGLIAKEMTEQVSRALQRLPEKMRIAIMLYDLEGFSCEEVAEVLGVPVGTVKSRLFNGRLRLRERLRPYMENR